MIVSMKFICQKYPSNYWRPVQKPQFEHLQNLRKRSYVTAPIPLIDLRLSIKEEFEGAEAEDEAGIFTGLEGKDRASLNCPVKSQVSSFTWGIVNAQKWSKFLQTHSSLQG